MFPESGFDKLDAGNLGKKYEGNSRPGHFDGVITVSYTHLTLPTIRLV